MKDTMQFFGIIPARYASTRFPGKPLADIQGKSMIRRVYEQALKAGIFQDVVVATDDQRILEHVDAFGKAVLTSDQHPSGTDRCYEAAEYMSRKWKRKPHDVVVNIQGDEPFIDPGQIKLLCECFDNPDTHIATLVKKIDSSKDLFNPNVVKVVTGLDGKALYFSRSAVPFCRTREKSLWLEENSYFKHIGMYAYRFNVLDDITKLQVSPLEKAESLEQLRWLENGFHIQTRITLAESHAVDTPEDLEKFNPKQ